MGQIAPTAFQKVVQSVQEILEVAAGMGIPISVEVEARCLIQAAYFQEEGRSLSSFDFYSGAMGEFSPRAAQTALQWARQRASGIPLQHLTGVQVFGENEYAVGPEVLIPRPETEILLRSALVELATRPPRLGLEIGLGSGVLSIELLAYFPALRILASELTPAARVLARKNAEKILGNASDRLQILIADESAHVWEPFEQVGASQADFLISNPPYLGEVSEVTAEVLAHEPREALFAPPQDLLFFYREIAQGARKFIRSSGFVFMEVPHERASDILKLFKKPQWDARILPDLSQRPRVLIAKLERANG